MTARVRAMHTDVSNILSRELGAATDFKLAETKPNLDDVNLAGPLNGQLQFIRTADGLSVKGEISAKLELQCHRCLRNFDYSVKARLNGEFADRPAEDQWPIVHNQIDLAPLVRQELILAIPSKQLDRPDCPGIAYNQGEFKNQPRIRKGK